MHYDDLIRLRGFHERPLASTGAIKLISFAGPCGVMLYDDHIRQQRLRDRPSASAAASGFTSFPARYDVIQRAVLKC